MIDCLGGSCLEIRDEIKESLARYVEHHIPTGGFLEAVLTNDLVGAVGRADEGNYRTLKQIMCHVYNCLPSMCWGSPVKVQAWLDACVHRAQAA